MSLLKKAFTDFIGFSLVLFCLVAIAATLASFQFWLFLRLPAKPYAEKKQFFIPPKTGAYRVAVILESQGVISDARTFYLLAWTRNSLRRLQAGEYAFSTLDCPEQVLDKIVNGKVVIHTVTLPEGSTMWDVARILDQKELSSQKEVLETTMDPQLAESLKIDAHGLEGYLFPDTYHFKKPISSTAIATAMVRQFWQQLPPEWAQRRKELGLSLHQLITLASIIEKEAAVDSERPIIAGVFYNRLKIGMPLQSDPTAVYDIPGFSGPVTASHLSRQSPYNTYRIKGLPPGPICSPGAKSIKAALYPEKVPYIYFVSNNDGTHHFSVTRQEHQEAVSHYYEMKKKAAEDKSPKAGDQPITPLPGESPAEVEPSAQNPGT